MVAITKLEFSVLTYLLYPVTNQCLLVLAHDLAAVLLTSPRQPSEHAYSIFSDAARAYTIFSERAIVSNVLCSVMLDGANFSTYVTSALSSSSNQNSLPGNPIKWLTESTNCKTGNLVKKPTRYGRGRHDGGSVWRLLG